MVKKCLSVVLCYVVESVAEAAVAVLTSWLAAAAACSAAVAGMVAVEALNLETVFQSQPCSALVMSVAESRPAAVAAAMPGSVPWHTASRAVVLKSLLGVVAS